MPAPSSPPGKPAEPKADTVAEDPRKSAAFVQPGAQPDAPPERMNLRFHRSMGKYCKGDVAEFPYEYAQQILRKGVATVMASNVTGNAGPGVMVRK